MGALFTNHLSNKEGNMQYIFPLNAFGAVSTEEVLQE